MMYKRLKTIQEKVLLLQLLLQLNLLRKRNSRLNKPDMNNRKEVIRYSFHHWPERQLKRKVLT
jgi:hypothetical protein